MKPWLQHQPHPVPPSSFTAWEHCRLREQAPKQTKWVPAITNREEILIGMRLLDKHAPIDFTTIRLRNYRDMFIRVNGYSSFEQSIPALVGQLVASGLAPSTMSTYWRKICGDIQHPGILQRRAATAFRLLAAQSDVRHAIDLDPFELEEVLDGMRVEDRGTREVSELTLKTGLRVADLMKCKRKHIIFGDENLSVTVLVAKNIRSQGERRTITIPYWFGKVSYATVDYWYRFPAEVCPFANIDIRDCYARYRETRHPETTTYTFRRAFVQRAVAECGGDFREAAHWYTLHKNPRIIAAHYMPHNDDLE